MNPQSKQPQEREISSGVIVYRQTEEGPRFLILYSGKNSWTFPRGKIEKEERSFEAAVRETREETGLTRSHLQFVDYFKAYENWTFMRNGKRVRKTVIFYLAQTDRRDIHFSEERWSGYVWATKNEALRFFAGGKHRENRKVLAQVYAFLQGKKPTPPAVQGEHIQPAPPLPPREQPSFRKPHPSRSPRPAGPYTQRPRRFHQPHRRFDNNRPAQGQ